MTLDENEPRTKMNWKLEGFKRRPDEWDQERTALSPVDNLAYTTVRFVLDKLLNDTTVRRLERKQNARGTGKDLTR